MSYELVLPDPLELANVYGDHPSSYESVVNTDDHTVKELYQLHLDALEELQQVQLDATKELNRRFWESLAVVEKEDLQVLANQMKGEGAYSELVQEAAMEDLEAEASLASTPEELAYDEYEEGSLPNLSEVLADLYVTQTVESA